MGSGTSWSRHASKTIRMQALASRAIRRYTYPMPHPADPNTGPDDWDPDAPEAGPPEAFPDMPTPLGPGVPRLGFETSPEIAQLFEALAAAQGEIGNAEKSAENPHLKNRYADLASCWAACRGPLSKHGICLAQPPSTRDGGHVTVLTILGHKSGQWMRGELKLPTDKVNAQAVGSAITYARRYGLCAMVGIAPGDDDDGNAATAGATAAASRTPYQSASAAPELGPARRKAEAKWKALAVLLKTAGRNVDPAEWAATALGHDPETADDYEHLAGLIDDEMANIRAKVAQNRSGS